MNLPINANSLGGKCFYMDSRNLTSNFVSDHRTALFQNQFGGDDRNWRSLISDIKGESSSMNDMLRVVGKVSRTESLGSI